MTAEQERTEQERKRILDEARATIAARLDAGAHDDDGLARWDALQKAHKEREPEGGAAAMAAPEPPPAPVINSEAWNKWWDANYATARAQESDLTEFMRRLLADVIARGQKALAQERHRSEDAINKLRTEMCRHVTDTLGRIENVLTAERVSREAEREADRAARGIGGLDLTKPAKPN